MLNLLGCTVTHDCYAAWQRHVVADPEPIYLTDKLLSLLPPGMPVLPREQSAHLGLSASQLDTYASFRVSREATWVTRMASSLLDELPPENRYQLLAEQRTLGRDLVYTVAEVESLLPPEVIERHAWQADDGRLIAMHGALWATLTEAAKWRWITGFVTRYATPYAIVPATQVPTLAPWVAAAANTFCASNGPNCFSTALAAATPDAALAESISSLWLTAEGFVEGLAQRGYREYPAADEHLLVADTIVVWWDDERVARHACTIIADGIALNKEAQTWYAPRQLVPIEAVIAAWADEGYHRTLFQRE